MYPCSHSIACSHIIRRPNLSVRLASPITSVVFLSYSLEKRMNPAAGDHCPAEERHDQEQQ